NRFVDALVYIGEDTALHEIGDNLERFLLKLLGQLPYDDRWLDGDNLCVGGQDNLSRTSRSFRRLGAGWALLRRGEPGTRHGGTVRRGRSTADSSNISTFCEIVSSGFDWPRRHFDRWRLLRSFGHRLWRKLDETDLVAEFWTRRFWRRGRLLRGGRRRDFGNVGNGLGLDRRFGGNRFGWRRFKHCRCGGGLGCLDR